MNRNQVVAWLLLLAGCGAISANDKDTTPLPACEWCGADEAPKDHEWSWDITIAGVDEPGERLVVSGTVYKPDGKSPAPDVIMYLYHTNAKGIYPKRGNETGNARRHGYLRNWLKTNDKGQYRFSTIRPAQYPSRTEPAHIHVTIKEPGKDEYWIDVYEFADDPLLTKVDRKSSGILDVSRDENGVWTSSRDIILVP